MGDLLPNSEITTPTTFDIVKDAVRRSLQDQYDHPLRGLPAHIQMDHEERLKYATDGGCLWGSALALKEILSEHNEKFDALFIVSSGDIKRDSWLSKLGIPPREHSYLFAKGKDDLWYASSPANHGANNEDNYATTIFQDKELSVILKKIEERDLMALPSVEEINKISADHGSFEIVSTTKFNVKKINIIDGLVKADNYEIDA
jgi:hypothetical protein